MTPKQKAKPEQPPKDTNICVCGTPKTGIVQSALPPRHYYMVCMGCGRVGHHGASEKEARAMWNGAVTGKRDPDYLYPAQFDKHPFRHGPAKETT